MISLEDALYIHQKSVKEFGGASGVRDEGLLEASLGRPFQTFDQQDLFETPTDKAAAILESVIINHPFMDGNKRTAYVLSRTLLNFMIMTFMPLKKRNTK